MDVDEELDKLRRARRPRRSLDDESLLEIVLWELLKGVNVEKILFLGIVTLGVGMTLFAGMCSAY